MRIKADPFLKTLTCLYVEDDVSIREPFLMMIGRYFHEVIVAENGEQGLAKFKEHTPDIIISDIRMPVMDGIEMVSRIKEIDSNVLIVFITAFSDVEYLKQAIDLGVDGYITKPVDKNKLLEKLNKFAAFIRHEKEIKEYTVLLQKILDKQSTPIVLLEKEHLKYKNKAFVQIFPDTKSYEELLDILQIDFGKKVQKIDIKHNEMKLTFEVTLQHISEDVMLITLQDISEYEEEILLDKLTNVYNRKVLDRILPKMFGSEMCVIMLDIDNFKNVNDTYGHLVGDDVLRFIVDILKKSLRKNDIIVRFGGEEFVVILDGIHDSEIMYKIAQTLRERIEKQKIDQVGYITCSFGVCCAYVDNHEAFTELIEDVDAALYEAKRTGKNKVLLCSKLRDGNG